MAGAQHPPAQGGRRPGGRWRWTDRGLAPLTSVPVSLSLSLVVRNPGTSSVPRVGSQEQKAAQFLVHLALVCFSGWEGSCLQVHPSDWDIGDSGGSGMGLSPHTCPTSESLAQTITHSGCRQNSQLPGGRPGGLGSQGSRETLTPSSCPQPPSCPWLCRSSCHPLPKNGQGQRRPWKSWTWPRTPACWRRCVCVGEGRGRFRGQHRCARSGTSCTHRRTLCLTLLTTFTPRRCPPASPREEPFREGLGVGSVSTPPHRRGGGGAGRGPQLLWPRCTRAGGTGRRPPGVS